MSEPQGCNALSPLFLLLFRPSCQPTVNRKIICRYIHGKITFAHLRSRSHSARLLLSYSPICLISFTVISMHAYRIGALLLAPDHLRLGPDFSSPDPDPARSSCRRRPIALFRHRDRLRCVLRPRGAFAVEDFKAFLAARDIAVSNSAPVHILVTRYGSPLSKSIYAESLPRAASAPG